MIVFGVWCLVFGFGVPGFRRKTGFTLGYFPPTLRGENADLLIPLTVGDFLLLVA